MIVIEMNPRVSRSSALASKATGFPIAKIAAQLAIGYTLDEIPNDITRRRRPASSRPSTTSSSRCRGSPSRSSRGRPRLTTNMKSVGEAMAIGRNFPEALQKALRSLERTEAGFAGSATRATSTARRCWSRSASRTTAVSRRSSAAAGRRRRSSEVHDATDIDPWFLDQIALINEVADEVRPPPSSPRSCCDAKRHGFSDAQIAGCARHAEDVVRGVRHALGIRPVYKTVDTCAAEFAALTPYHYSTYDEETEVEPREGPAVIILGSGPNRIGQGIEFDYSCVHASLTLREAGYETDHDQLQPRDGLHGLRHLRPAVLRAADPRGRPGGRPRRAAGRTGRRRHRASSAGRRRWGWPSGCKDAGVPILGTTPEAIDLAEERGAFGRVLAEAGLPAPKHGTRATFDEAQGGGRRDRLPGAGPPLVRARRSRHGDRLRRGHARRLHRARHADHRPSTRCSSTASSTTRSRSTSTRSTTARSCTSAGSWSTSRRPASTPATRRAPCRPSRWVAEDIDRIRDSTEAIARGVGVLRAAQRAVRDRRRRALRPGGQPARVAHGAVRVQGHGGPAGQGRGADRHGGRAIAGPARRRDLPPDGDGGDLPDGAAIAVKEAVLPFGRFHGVDTVLGPEMRSTGEVMGIDDTSGRPSPSPRRPRTPAACPPAGRSFVSVANRDKRAVIFPLKRLADLGFRIAATGGTADGAAPQRGRGDATAQEPRGPGRGDDHRGRDHRPATSR